MKISSQLKQIRKDYLKIEPPPDLVKYGWLALRKEIAEQERHRFAFFPLFARNVVFAMMAMVLLGSGFIGLVKASQSSLPGDTLYPLKRLSETVTTAISGDHQIRIEKRAEEVVGVAKEKNDPAILKRAVKEYQKAVSETKQEAEKSGNTEEFQAKLKKQEQQFQAVSEQVSSSKDVLKEAIEASKKGRDSEVKGIEHKETSSEVKQEIEDSGEKEEIEATKKEIKEIIR